MVRLGWEAPGALPPVGEWMIVHLDVDESLVDRAMDQALQAGATYADVRVESGGHEGAQAENGIVKCVNVAAGTSAGVRALAGGTWGFASGDISSQEEVGPQLFVLVASAVRLAKAAARFERVELAPITPVHRKVQLPRTRTPIPLEEKQHLAAAISTAMMGVPAMRMAVSGIYHEELTRTFASTEGSRIVEDSLHVSGDLYAAAHHAGTSQAYFRAFGATGGWEHIDRIDPMALGLEVATKTSRLVTQAITPKQRETTVVTHPEFNSLKVHEIVGHPVEGDRILGGESAWAGRAWWKDLSGQQVGSELIHAVSDATPNDRHAGFYGTFFYDDEGVPAQRIEHIVGGKLCNFLENRQTAAITGGSPSGAMRASSASVLPMIRMTNTYFEADPEGPATLEETIEDIHDGVLLGHMSIPSIDSRRYRWQIAAYEGYEIKDGHVGQMLKNISLIARTPEYLRSVYRVGGPKTFALHQIPNCGKGDPMQLMRVGNGGPLMVGTGRISGAA